jgi:hypothetical protein
MTVGGGSEEAVSRHRRSTQQSALSPGAAWVIETRKAVYQPQFFVFPKSNRIRKKP